MLYERKGLRVFVYQQLIDMRSGFERLHSYCLEGLGAKMNEGHLYVFFGRNRRRLKVLWYDGSGLVLATKRIEKGSFMELDTLLGRSEITQEEFKLILHGSVIKRPEVERFKNNKMTQREQVALARGSLDTAAHGSSHSTTFRETRA